MRPIEFRGFSEKEKRWYFGLLVPRTLLVEPQSLSEFWIATGFEDEVFPVLPESVGQFTGLMDKVGVKIFEGDIVRAADKYTLTIVFDEGRFFGSSGTIDVDLCLNADKMVVIGNAYEGVKK